MKKKLLLLFLILFVCWPLFVPGPKVANDYHYLYQSDARNELNWPFAWRNTITAEGLGEYAVITLWSWPLNFLYGLFSNLSVEYSILTRIIGVLPIFVLGFWGMHRLLVFLQVKPRGELAGSFFYILNSYLLLLIDGGQLNLGLAYALMPWAFLFYRQFIKGGVFKYLLFFGVFSLLISVADFRILFLVGLLLGLDFIMELALIGEGKLKLLKKFISVGGFCFLVLLGSHFFWILPAFLAKIPGLPATYSRESQVSFLSFANIGHGFLGLSPHWYKNIFGVISKLRAEYIFIPILILMAPLLKRADRSVLFFLIVYLMSVFLVKGSNPPFPGVYPWLFLHIPGFSLFRDPSKFYFLLDLAGSYLIAVTIGELSDLFSKFNKRIFKKEIVIFLFVVYVVALCWPVWLVKMGGIFSSNDLETEFGEQAVILGSDLQFSRILWLPSKAPLGFSSGLHPSLEGLRLGQLRPFAGATVGNYETLNFLREASYSGQLLDILGVKYISYPPPDPKRSEFKPDQLIYHNLFFDQLAARDWIKNKVGFSLPMLETKSHQDHFFLAPNLWWVVGSDDIYGESTKSAELRLSKNALVFSDEHPGFLNKINQFPQAKILVNKKNLPDLAAGFIPEEQLIFPARNLDFSPGVSGWWKRESVDLVWWKDFLKTKYGINNLDFDLGGGFAISEGPHVLNLTNDKLKKGQLLLARVLESSRSGVIDFSQGGQWVGSIDTSQPSNEFSWFEVGELKDNNQLAIQTKGEINVINSLAILNREDWASDNLASESLKKAGRVLEFKPENVTTGSGLVSFNQINPAKYQVFVSGLKTSEYLVFSESSDSQWLLNGKAPLPAYSMLNVYQIDKNGEYTLEYAPQKYVNYGLVISGLTVFIIILLLFKTFFGTKLSTVQSRKK